MSKRKQDLSGAKKDEADKAWSVLGKIGSDCKRQRINKRNQPQSKNSQGTILAQEVVYDLKSKYNTKGIKKIVQLVAAYSFDSIVESVWNHWEELTNMEISRATHTIKVLLQLRGPEVNTTEQLNNKRDLYFAFEKDVTGSDTRSLPRTSSVRQNFCSSRQSSAASTPSTASAPSIAPSAVSGSVPKSVRPPFVFNAAKFLELGMPNREEKIFEQVYVKSYRYDEVTESVLWGESFVAMLQRGIAVGSGGFRDAFKASVKGVPELEGIVSVLKIYQQDAVTERVAAFAKIGKQVTREYAIKDLNEKAVQVQTIAELITEGFSSELKQKLGAKAATFGRKFFRYEPTWLVNFDNGIYGTIERFISGTWVKYINNDMRVLNVDPDSSTYFPMAHALAHYSLSKGEGKYMVTDMQGIDNVLSDAEVASEDSVVKVGNSIFELPFNSGNHSEAIQLFTDSHGCNDYCNALQLPELN